MPVRRIRDAGIVNAIAAASDVRALMFLGAPYPNAPLDFTPWVEDERSITLLYGGFCALFVWRGPNIYECHLMVRKSDRGARGLATGREMLAWMAANGARRVWGQPSVHNRAAITYIRRMGLKSQGLGIDPIVGEVEYFMTEDLCRR